LPEIGENWRSWLATGVLAVGAVLAARSPSGRATPAWKGTFVDTKSPTTSDILANIIIEGKRCDGDR
jgi:hypothetical protein